MAARLIVRKASNADMDGLRALVKDAAQDGAIKISYEREPDYFTATRVPTTDAQVYVLEDTHSNHIAGAFCLGHRPAFVNGEVQRVWYGNELRIHSEYRGGIALHRLFRHFRKALGDHWMQTIIMGDNQASLSSVASGRAGLPVYYPAGETISCLMSVRQRLQHNSTYQVRRAARRDLPDIQALYNREAARKQLAPAYDFSRLGSEDTYYHGLNLHDVFLAFDGAKLKGIAGLWDQTSFKQSRIVKYAPALRISRPAINFVSKLNGGLQLPAEGAISHYAYLHNAVTDGNDPLPLRALLSTILKECRQNCTGKVDAIVTGFDANDPLLEALRGLKLRRMPAKQFLASYSGDPRTALNSNQLFYVEPSRM